MSIKKENNYLVTGDRNYYGQSFATYAEAEAQAKDEASDNYKPVYIWTKTATVQNKLPVDIQVTKV